MKRTPLLIAVLVLTAGVAHAQPVAFASTIRPLFAAPAIGRDALATAGLAGIAMPVGGSRSRAARPSGAALSSTSNSPAAVPGPWHLGVDFTLPSVTPSTVSHFTLAAEARFWQLTLQTGKPRKGDIDWQGLFTQQTRVDATMHWLRLRQPKFHAPLYHSAYFPGYRDAMKGYYSLPLRWDDGDDFMTNDIGHPIIGALFAYTFTDYDRRCSNLVFGEGNYWSCMKRAAIYSALASANWEWNPVMSESALGHIGKFYTCENGRCKGEGGWTDLVVTPLGGMGIRIAGDLARTRLWPVLDRTLSGGPLARALNYTVKTLTAPSHFLNCAFKIDFTNAWNATPSKARRAS